MLSSPASLAARRVRSSISGRKSSPITVPSGPVRRAAMMVSIPPAAADVEDRFARLDVGVPEMVCHSEGAAYR